MKLRHLSIAIVLMFSAHNALAVDSAGSFAVKGVGLSKCSAFVEVVKAKETATLSRYIGWVAGYISASNQHISNTFDLTPWQNIRDRSNWQYFLDSWAHVRGPSETDQETEKQRNAPYYARAFSGARLTADSPAR